jgi:hypothetical protein
MVGVRGGVYRILRKLSPGNITKTYLRIILIIYSKICHYIQGRQFARLLLLLICDLFNDNIGSLDCTASNGRMANEQWTEKDVEGNRTWPNTEYWASRHFIRGTGEKNEKPQSIYTAYRQRIEPGNFGIQSRSANHHSIIFEILF